MHIIVILSILNIICSTLQKPKKVSVVSANFTLLIILFLLFSYSILKIFKNKNTELHRFKANFDFPNHPDSSEMLKMKGMDSSVGSDEGNRMRDSSHKFEACWGIKKLSLKNPSVLYMIVEPTQKNLKCFDFKFFTIPNF